LPYLLHPIGRTQGGRGEIIFLELYDHRTDPEEQNNLAESSLEIVWRFQNSWQNIKTT